MRKGREVGRSQQVCSPALLHGNKCWVGGRVFWRRLHGSHRGFSLSRGPPSHQSLLCPIEGMLLARPHQWWVKMAEPGLGSKRIPSYPWCYNTTSVHSGRRESLAGWVFGAGFSLFKDNKEIQCFFRTWVVDWDLYPLHSLVLVMISFIVEFFGYFTYSLFSKVYYVFDDRDHLKITVILLSCAWNITLCTQWVFSKYPWAAQSLQSRGSHLVCWA